MKSLIVSLLFACVLLASVEDSEAQGKKVVCYYGTWAVYRPGDGKFDVEDIPINLCTHIIYGFTDLGTDNTIALYDPWNDVTDGGGKGALLRFTGLKRLNPNLKTLVANGGWNAGSTKYSKMAANPADRAKFVQSVVAFVKQYNFDGFDFDWEYPSCVADFDQDRVCGPSSDKANYASLLRELKAALIKENPTYMLTAAVHCGKTIIDNGYDIPTLIETLDQFHVMTYDYHGAWEKVTGLNAPLYSNPFIESGNETWFNADWTINYYLNNGVPASKIIMGTAVYGRGFTLANPNENGLLAATNGPIPEGPWVRQNGSWGYHEICTKQKEGGWTVVRDPCFQAPYAYKNNLWIGYDDVESLTLKGRYISAKQLGGAMIWEIDFDDFKGLCSGTTFALTKAVSNAINAPATLPPQCTSPTTTTTTATRPTCPPIIPENFICVCNDVSCELVYVPSTTPATTVPTCPPIPDNSYCVCNAVTCTVLPITTTTQRPTCPPYDPNVNICICGATSCILEPISTTTTSTTTTTAPTTTTTVITTPARPTCPPYDPNVYICICGATSCQLELKTTTTPAPPTCPPHDPNVYICVCGATSCQLQLRTTTTPAPPTCPPNIPSGFTCECSATTCVTVQTTTTTSPTPTTTRKPSTEFDCSSRPNGNYPDPAGPCTGFFYMCSNGIAYLYDCAFQDLVFYPPTDKCEHRSDVYPCNIKKP